MNVDKGLILLTKGSLTLYLIICFITVLIMPIYLGIDYFIDNGYGLLDNIWELLGLSLICYVLITPIFYVLCKKTLIEFINELDVKYEKEKK